MDEIERSNELRISVADVADLFAAPAPDPFSRHESRIVGEPGIQRIGRESLAWDGPPPQRLVVLVPAAQLRPGLGDEVAAALRRHCAVRVSDNRQRLGLMRSHGVQWLLRGAVILAVCIAISSVFRNELIPALPPFLNAALGEGFNVIGWVMLWKPFEAFVFDPLPLKRDNRVLEFLGRLPIEVRAQPAEAA
jgi:hypothetical protein